MDTAGQLYAKALEMGDVRALALLGALYQEHGSLPEALDLYTQGEREREGEREGEREREREALNLTRKVCVCVCVCVSVCLSVCLCFCVCMYSRWR